MTEALWTIFLAGVASTCGLVTVVGGLVWLIIRLSLRPIEQMLATMSKRLDDMITREEVERLVELRITQHVQRCLDRKEKIEQSHERESHGV